MWSKKFKNCIKCHTTNKPHVGFGLCIFCYRKHIRETKKDSIKYQQRNWYLRKKKENPNHFRLKNMRNKIGQDPLPLFKKYKGKCSECGSKSYLHIHHKDNKGSNLPIAKRNNSLDNLVLLCRSCHGKLHGSITCWSRKHDRCIICKTKNYKHHANGVCRKCIGKYQYRNRKKR